MNIYRKNTLNQLKGTFEELLEECKDELTPQEIFNMAKEYEIGLWKEQMEGYKINSNNLEFNIKDSIKMCKMMIKELSKIKITDIS
ncbi:MAG: hypothetical protein MJA82_11020 [Clostridia bacterium]|nr:hypothetical protein [Clostridia bacterium]